MHLTCLTSFDSDCFLASAFPLASCLTSTLAVASASHWASLFLFVSAFSQVSSLASLLPLTRRALTSDATENKEIQYNKTVTDYQKQFKKIVRVQTQQNTWDKLEKAGKKSGSQKKSRIKSGSPSQNQKQSQKEARAKAETKKAKLCGKPKPQPKWKSSKRLKGKPKPKRNQKQKK